MHAHIAVRPRPFVYSHDSHDSAAHEMMATCRFGYVTGRILCPKNNKYSGYFGELFDMGLESLSWNGYKLILSHGMIAFVKW